MKLENVIILGKENSNNQSSKTALSLSVAIGLFCSLFLFCFFLSRPASLANSPAASSEPGSLPLFLTPFTLGNASDSSPHLGRPLYPYSVIPRGVSSRQELLATLHRDPVVAAHYRNFNSGASSFIRLPSDRRAFVSHRLGDRIFWTSKKMTLHVGETLLTDGSHLARTRCGNLISYVPALPTSAVEPSEQVLANPVIPPRPELAAVATPIGNPLWTDTAIPPIVLSSSFLPPSPVSGPTPLEFFPPFLPITCCGSSSTPTPEPPLPLGPLPPPTHRPAPTCRNPEPCSYFPPPCRWLSCSPIFVTAHVRTRLAIILCTPFINSSAPSLQFLAHTRDSPGRTIWLVFTRLISLTRIKFSLHETILLWLHLKSSCSIANHGSDLKARAFFLGR
jgi:hypothetical protein